MRILIIFSLFIALSGCEMTSEDWAAINQALKETNQQMASTNREYASPTYNTYQPSNTTYTDSSGYRSASDFKGLNSIDCEWVEETFDGQAVKNLKCKCVSEPCERAGTQPSKAINH